MDKPQLRTARPVARLRPRADWYQIQAKADSDTADVRIYDEIGGWFGITAADFAGDLEKVTADRIDLRLNTPGGDVFDGIAIFNTLRQHPAEVHVFVDGLAASAGSVIAMAGDRITMQRGSMLMIHDGWGLTIGNAGDHRKTADLLDQASDNIAGIYAARARGPAEGWRDRMRAETWYTAAEAVAAGLADDAEPDEDEDTDGGEGDEKVAARFDLSVFAYAGRGDAPPPVIEPVTNVHQQSAGGVHEQLSSLLDHLREGEAA